MRTRSVRILRLTAPLMVLLLVSSVAPVYAGDPVPGIDISLEEIPGGKMWAVETDTQGNYVSEILAPGTYVLRIGSLDPPDDDGPDPVENHNSSRSNKTYPIRPSDDGIWDYTVNFEVSQEVLPGKDPGTIITIGNQGPGRISGQVAMVVTKWTIRGQLNFKPTATREERERIKTFNGTDLVIRDNSSDTIIARTTSDNAGYFSFEEIDPPSKEGSIVIGWSALSTNGFCYAPLPSDPAPPMELMEECDPGGPVMITIPWLCYNPPCPGEDEDVPLPISVEKALDENNNNLLDDIEVLIAIKLWIEGKPVPGVNATINDAQIKDLIRIWITGEKVGTANEEVWNQPIAAQIPIQPLLLEQTSITQKEGHFTVGVQGQGIAQLNLQIFDLSGRRVLDETSTDMRLSFQAMDESDRRWANGVYLYIVTAYGFNGQVVRSNVGKFALVN